MAAAEMGAVMGTSFDQLGKFMGENRVTPLAVEVGFPVAEDDLAKAAGNINAGETPAGHAVKTVHRGPYETLKVTYKALENDLKTRGIVMGKVGWEI